MRQNYVLYIINQNLIIFIATKNAGTIFESTPIKQTPYFIAMGFLIELVLMAAAILIAAFIIPGVHVDGFWNAVLAALLISITNGFIGGILRILTFPLNILTLGLTSFVITVLMIMLADSMMSGFSTSSFWVTALFAIVLAVFKTILFNLVRK